ECSAAPAIPHSTARLALGRLRTLHNDRSCASASVRIIGYIRAACANTTASGLNAHIVVAASAVLSSNISQPSANTSTSVVSEKITDIERNEISLSPKIRA